MTRESLEDGSYSLITSLVSSNYDLEAKNVAFHQVSLYTSELTLKVSVSPLHPFIQTQ